MLAPVQRAVRQTVDLVTFCLNAIEQADLSELGERVTFKAEEFHDIGFGCLVIAQDLLDRLPSLPAQGVKTRSADD